MTLLEIDAFLSIVRCGSISASAKELFVTQPALSRRLKALEDELQYQLIIREKGMHAIQLTEEGKAFLPMAEKWKLLWEDTSAIRTLDQKPVLKIASIESVSTYILPKIFQEFLQEKQHNLRFHLCHSQEAYGDVESGLVDFALISNPRYSKNVQTIPVFSEPFVLASRKQMTVNSNGVEPEELEPGREVRLPWNQEYDIWHRQWFEESIYPNVFLDQMSLMEEFLTGENWAIVPWSVGEKLKEKGVTVYPLQNGPTDRVIYYLIKNNDKKELVEKVLHLLSEYIKTQCGLQSLIL